MKRTIYFISGPAGVGKSSTAEKLVKTIEKSAYISGDDISRIPVNGRGQPWLCSDTLSLTWENILSVTRNLLKYNYDVVIDYVTFPKELNWFLEQIKDIDTKIIYVVLLVDQETLVYRDSQRPPEDQMGERSTVLLKEFNETLIDDRYVIDTSNKKISELETIIHEITTDKRFIFEFSRRTI